MCKESNQSPQFGIVWACLRVCLALCVCGTCVCVRRKGSISDFFWNLLWHFPPFVGWAVFKDAGRKKAHYSCSLSADDGERKTCNGCLTWQQQITDISDLLVVNSKRLTTKISLFGCMWRQQSRPEGAQNSRSPRRNGLEKIVKKLCLIDRV